MKKILKCLVALALIAAPVPGLFVGLLIGWIAAPIVIGIHAGYLHVSNFVEGVYVAHARRKAQEARP